MNGVKRYLAAQKPRTLHFEEAYGVYVKPDGCYGYYTVFFFRRSMEARPISPAPINPTDAGSGTEVAENVPELELLIVPVVLVHAPPGQKKAWI